MAGDHPTLRKDAEIERFYHMRENMHKNFRMTKKTGPFVLLAGAIIPGMLLYGAYKYSGQTDFVAKRRHESVWRSHHNQSSESSA